jgi:glycosyltransferase involved in cell wall biosynthesis
MNKPLGKGQGWLIEAAARLKPKYPDLRFMIVGEGPIMAELKALARKLKVDDIVIFSGYVENIEEYISVMDIFCFLAWDKEGFGQVMVEAQALAKPVIGTNIGGIPETFQENISGYLIKPKDVDSLVIAIEKLLIDKNKADEMGERGLEFVRNAFSIGKMAAEIKKIYEEILTAGSRVK